MVRFQSKRVSPKQEDSLDSPKYLMIDLEQESLIYDLTDEEKLEIASKRIMKQYKPAFEELAK